MRSKRVAHLQDEGGVDHVLRRRAPVEGALELRRQPRLDGLQERDRRDARDRGVASEGVEVELVRVDRLDRRRELVGREAETRLRARQRRLHPQHRPRAGRGPKKPPASASVAKSGPVRPESRAEKVIERVMAQPRGSAKPRPAAESAAQPLELLAQELELEPAMLGRREIGLGSRERRGGLLEQAGIAAVERRIGQDVLQPGDPGLELGHPAGQRLEVVLLVEGEPAPGRGAAGRRAPGRRAGARPSRPPAPRPRAPRCASMSV